MASSDTTSGYLTHSDPLALDASTVENDTITETKPPTDVSRGICYVFGYHN